VNTELIKNELENEGWKDVRPGSHMDIHFDLVGRRSFILTKWNILVKVLPMLDEKVVDIWKANFESISRKSKSPILGKCFLLCLLAEDVSTEVSNSLSADSFGLFGVVRMKAGGGNMLVADAMSKQVYGNIPTLPYDVHKFSKSAKAILAKGIGASNL